ncbi:hypothetical protein KIN20_010438, partial [Parelaphostrongylus tenuis]
GQLAIRSQRTDGTSDDRKPNETVSTKLKNAPTMTTMPKETDGTIEMPANVTNSTIRKTALKCMRLSPIQRMRNLPLECRQL